jgi:hypothetical protein
MRIVTLLFLFLLPMYAFWFSTPKPKIIEIKAPPLDIEYEKTMAVEYLNTLRQKAGMSPYMPSPLLEKAAQSHANYLILNHEQGHLEKPSKRGFTGETPARRTLQAGYNVSMITENISVNALGYQDAVEGLFSAIYHRFGFLDFQSDEIGTGIVQDSKNSNNNAYVFDMGIYELNDLCSQKSYHERGKYVYKVCKDPNHRIDEALFKKALNLRKSLSRKIVIYPYDGQKEIPPAFYKETPDPLPDYDVSGFPISIQFNDYFYKHVRVTSFVLFDNKNKKVPARILDAATDPNIQFNKTQFALFPLKRLSYNTRYKAVVHYRADGKNGTKIWHFQTKTLHKPFFVIQKNRAEITIRPNTTYQLYFVPANGHDILEDLIFPADVRVKFLDPNTIELKLTTQNSDDFEIKSGKKVVQVHVKAL